jgi:8-oxo-dGTP pyrophosphatase MutT (NUDIX family)
MTSQTLLEQLKSSLLNYQGRIIEQPTMAEAGVLVAITEEADPHLVLTKRADHLSTHSGEVAFAGGKRDDTDPDIIYTALREAHEEIALPSDNVQIIGQLDQVFSRFGYIVTPVVGLVSPQQKYQANLDELDAVFKVPVRFFLQNEPSGFFERGNFSIPSYDFNGFRIWGLTAMMIVEMMNNHFGANIKMKI